RTHTLSSICHTHSLTHTHTQTHCLSLCHTHSHTHKHTLSLSLTHTHTHTHTHFDPGDVKADNFTNGPDVPNTRLTLFSISWHNGSICISHYVRSAQRVKASTKGLSQK